MEKEIEELKKEIEVLTKRVEELEQEIEDRDMRDELLHQDYSYFANYWED